MSYLLCIILFTIPNDYGIPGVVDVVFDEPIYLDYEGSLFGDSDIPNASITTDRRIFVNQALLNLPKWMSNAVIAHEIGHRELGHFEQIAARVGAIFQGRISYDELDADNYALRLVERHDMICMLAFIYYTASNISFGNRYIITATTEVWMRAKALSGFDPEFPMWEECFNNFVNRSK
jgi:hypothetical protein